MMAIPLLILKLAITAWLVAVALWDLRTARIPNQLTFPAMAATGGFRLCLGLLDLGLFLLRTAYCGNPAAGGARMELVMGSILRAAAVNGAACSDGGYLYLGGNVQGAANLLFTLVAWAIIFGGWKLNVMGGGDAKLLMVLFALFPTYNFALTFCFVVLVALLPLLVLQHWGKRPLDALWEMVLRLRTGLFPTRQELEKTGKPYAWVFCLPGVIYLWLLW